MVSRSTAVHPRDTARVGLGSLTMSVIASMAALLASAEPMAVLTSGGTTFGAVFALGLGTWQFLEDR